MGISGDAAIVGAFLGDGGDIDSGSAYLFTTIPEPGTMLLLSMASLGLLMRRRRLS